jgi:FkbM family methyltransferase
MTRSILWKRRLSRTLQKICDFNLRKILDVFSTRGKLRIRIKRLKSEQRYRPFKLKIGDLLISGPDKASFASMWEEIYFNEIYAFSSSSKEKLILDIGANIGLSAMYFSQKYSTAVIHAYEADPTIFEYLKENIAINSIKNVYLHNKAIWKKDGCLEFHSEGADAGRISSESLHRNTITVEAVSLEEVMLSFGKEIDFVKMDIEGAETEVILSVSSTLALVRNLFIEYHSTREEIQSLNKILAVLTDNGFRYKLYNTFGEIPSKPFLTFDNHYLGMDLQINIIARRQN